MKEFFDAFGKNPFDFSKLQGDQATLKKGLLVTGDALLPKLKLVNNMLGRLALSVSVKKAFSNAASDLAAGKFDPKLAETSATLKGFTKQDIREKFLSKLNLATDAAAAKGHAEKLQNSIKDLTEAEYVAFTAATYAVLPETLKKAYDIILLDNGSVEDYARRFYRMTVDQKAQYQLDMAAKVPVDALVDFAYDMLQKADLAEMKIVAKYAFASVTPGEVADIATNGVGFAEELLKSVKEKNLLDVKDRRKAEALGKGLKKLFNGIEGGFIKAGLLNPAAFESLVKNSFQNTPKPGKNPPKFGT